MNVALVTRQRVSDWSRLWTLSVDRFAVGCERATPVGYTTVGELDALPTAGEPIILFYGVDGCRRIRFRTTDVVSYDPGRRLVRTGAAEYQLLICYDPQEEAAVS
jgi:hypothetical protein